MAAPLIEITFLYCTSDQISLRGGKEIPNGFYFGGNMEQVIEAINTKAAGEQEIQVFIGYCGWDEGELKAELEEGSWT